MTLFDNIKRIAKNRGLNLKEVAKKSQLGENAIYRWKNETPRIDSLNKVANTLGVTVAELTGETVNENAKQADIEDEDLLLAFDGMEIDEEDKQAIIDLLRFRRFQKRNEQN